MNYRLPETRPLSVIGAPSSAGAYGPGQERAPHAFRRHGFLSHLSSRGLDVTDRGDGTAALWRADDANPAASNVDMVAEIVTELADTVAAAMAAGQAVLVLGGDCTVELGTVAGASRAHGRVGLAYVDLDADLNTPETGDGILDWMGVAHLLDVAGADERLTTIGPVARCWTPMRSASSAPTASPIRNRSSSTVSPSMWRIWPPSVTTWPG